MLSPTRASIHQRTPKLAHRRTCGRFGGRLNALGNALGSSLADQTQGIGPYSSVDYQNGADIQSEGYIAPRASYAPDQLGSGSFGLNVDMSVPIYARASINGSAVEPADQFAGNNNTLALSAYRAATAAREAAALSAAIASRQLAVSNAVAANNNANYGHEGRGSTISVPFGGRSTITDPSAYAVPMGYGEQMRNLGSFVGDLGIGAVKGFDNLIPETAALAYRMTGYAAAGLVSLVNTDTSDRLFAQYGRVTGQVFEYDNDVQKFGGVAAQFAAPAIFKGMSASGSKLYEFEQSAKYTVNDQYRHLFTSTNTLESETTFYAYKNSAYLKTEYKPLELWMTPDLMSSQHAVQKLATPYATGYNALLTVTLPQGTKIVTPRPVWSMFGRPGGGTETRVYAPVTENMWRVGLPPN